MERARSGKWISLRPLRHAIVLTLCFVGVSWGAFYALARTLDYSLGGNLANAVAPLEWGATLFYVGVSSLLFLFGCVWLLGHLERSTQALQQAANGRPMAEERASQGAPTASILQDCSNLLMVVEGHARLLLRYTPAMGPDGSARLVQLEQALKRLSGLIGLFRKYTSAAQRTSSYDLGATVSECVEVVGHHPSLRGCQVETQLAATGPVKGSPLLVWIAVTNLVLNVAEATGPGGHIEVRVMRAEGEATIEVHGDGPGVPAANERRIVEPFHSAKQGGDGLGLLAVARCLEAHGGRIDLGRSPLGGACFRLHFPLPEPRPSVPECTAPALDTP